MADPRSLSSDKMSSQYKDELMRLYNRSKNEQYTAGPTSADKPPAEIPNPEDLSPPNPFAAAGAVSGSRFPMPDPASFFGNGNASLTQENTRENAGQTASVSETPKRSPKADDIMPKATGFVQAEVTTGGSFPVKSAVITVTENVGGRQYIRKILFSDSSGRTEIAELSADAPEGMPYKPYTIRAEASGFYSADSITVPVFPDIKSVQPIDLIPLPEGSRN